MMILKSDYDLGIDLYHISPQLMGRIKSKVISSSPLHDICLLSYLTVKITQFDIIQAQI